MGNSRSGSDRVLYSAGDSLREELGTNMGILAASRDEILSNLVRGNFLASVGDVVTLDLLDSGVVPDLSVVDYTTRRIPMAEVRSRFSSHRQPEVTVSNPPGVITQGLWDAIADGCRNPRKLRIVVRGEEDLASLACIALAPEGATVVYGIPGKGASINHVGPELRRLVEETLSKMRTHG